MKTLTQTVEEGGRREAYEALRDRIAEEIDAGVPARDLAALTRRLMQVIDALDEMDSGKEESGADELKRKREERRRRAANSSNRESSSG